MSVSNSNRISVRVNGKPKQVKEPISLSELLDEFQIRSDTVVLELNRQVVRKETYHSIYLCEGDSLEIVHFVGGGAGPE